MASEQISDRIAEFQKKMNSLTRPGVRPLYRIAATGLGASMWFFLMYRAKKDGPALLGWKHPWDH